MVLFLFCSVACTSSIGGTMVHVVQAVRQATRSEDGKAASKSQHAEHHRTMPYTARCRCRLRPGHSHSHSHRRDSRIEVQVGLSPGSSSSGRVSGAYEVQTMLCCGGTPRYAQAAVPYLTVRCMPQQLVSWLVWSFDSRVEEGCVSRVKPMARHVASARRLRQ